MNILLTLITIGSMAMAWNGKDYKKPSKAEIEKMLSKEQCHVTQDGGTERAFENKYWDHKEEGIYVDVVSGEPLFSSTDKYDSGTGWPSFTKPIDPANIITKADYELIVPRTEIRSKHADSHLGHVFDDGPKDKGGKRYCMNSASLRFVAKKDLEKEGYGEYLKLFGQSATGNKTVASLGDKSVAQSKTEKAILAAGCFWGVQHLIDEIPGVIKTKVGYVGGKTDNPTYKDVSRGDTNHAEAVEVEFDPSKLFYEKLLSYFWRLHNPTTLNRQGPDVGTQYRSVIFYFNEEQKKIAEASKKKFDESKVFSKPAVTQIVPVAKFYDAEEYHQKYVDKNPGYVCHALRDK